MADDKSDHHRYAILRLNPTTGAQYRPPTSSSSSSSSSSLSSPPKPNPSSRILSLLLQFVVMALILSLFLLFLGVAAVLLLHIFLATTVFHRRRPSSTASSAANLQTLVPGFKYAAVSPETAKDCAVCLESFKEGEWCRNLPACEHMFHENCIDNWLIKVPNCPVCRSPVCLNSGSSSSVISDVDCKLWWAVGV